MAGGSKCVLRTAGAGSKLAPATEQRGVRTEQTEQVAAGIAWATEVYRQALGVAPGAEATPLAELPVEQAERAREQAVREAPPAWEVREAVVVDGGADSQS